MSIDFSLVDIVADTIPPDAEPTPQAEFTCQVCGVPLHYGGRGRKPLFCDEHKKTKAKGVARTGGVKNNALAGQAADILMTSNSFIAFLARMAQLENTAEQIDIANPEFRDAAYRALLNDPELARAICRGGGMTGKMALIMAYAMFSMSVVPVAYFEIKAIRVARESDE